MAQFIAKKIQENVQDMKRHPVFRNCKMVYVCCFVIGFIMILLLGKNFIDDISLLSIDALKEVKNCVFESKEFFDYILWRRVLFLALGILFWWWGFGKWFLYGIIGSSACSMGICMYTCLIRYHLKGIFLWFFLYFPHIIFYAAALLCSMMISLHAFRTKTEKLKFLWQNIMWVICIFMMFALGVYMESYVNVTLLQDFLELF